MAGWPARRPAPGDLAALQAPVAKVAHQLWATSRALQAEWEVQDLIQEVMLRALQRLDQYQGTNGATLTTWVGCIARTHVVTMARAAARSQRRRGGDACDRSREGDVEHTIDLRQATKALLVSLRGNKHIPWGHETLNLLLKYGGDWNRVSLALTVHTGEAWTPESVRRVVEKIKRTEVGAALVGQLSIREHVNQ